MKTLRLGMAVSISGMALLTTGNLGATQWNCGFETSEGYEQIISLQNQQWESDQLKLALSSDAAKGAQSLALSGDGWLAHTSIETTGTLLTHLALKPSVSDGANESTLILLDGSVIGFAPSGEQAEVMIASTVEGKALWLPTGYTFNPTNWLTLSIVQDPEEKTWELYAGAEPIAGELPLQTEITPPGLTLLPGSNGTVHLDNIRQQSGSDTTIETFLAQAAGSAQSTSESLASSTNGTEETTTSSDSVRATNNSASTLTLSARSKLLKSFRKSNLEVFSPLREREVVINLSNEN
jgi:hypothetical protein